MVAVSFIYGLVGFPLSLCLFYLLPTCSIGGGRALGKSKKSKGDVGRKMDMLNEQREEGKLVRGVRQVSLFPLMAVEPTFLFFSLKQCR